MKYELSSQVVNNIIVFLDRTKFEGLKEVQGVNEIVAALNNPIKEENKPEEKKD